MIEITNSTHELFGTSIPLAAVTVVCGLAALVFLVSTFFHSDTESGARFGWQEWGFLCSFFGFMPTLIIPVGIDRNTERQNVADLKEVYSIEHIDTLGEKSLRRAVNKIPDREATAVTLTTDDGHRYDEARLVYHNINPDADPGEATHSISVEILDESDRDDREWVEFEP